MALDSPQDGGLAGIIVPAAPPGLLPEGRQPAAIGPWRLAGRRLRRNYVALFFLAFLPQFVDPNRGSVALQAEPRKASNQ